VCVCVCVWMGVCVCVWMGGWQRVLLLVEMMSSGLGGQLNMPCVANQSTTALVASIKDL
jgi:hypothetical protein